MGKKVSASEGFHPALTILVPVAPMILSYRANSRVLTMRNEGQVKVQDVSARERGNIGENLRNSDRRATRSL